MKPERRQRSYGYTKHEDAVAYAEKGWKPFKTRADWESSLRYKGTQGWPQESK